MKNLLTLTFAALFVCGCQQVPEPAQESFYISTLQNDAGKRLASCSFRYRIDNSYARLDNQLQRMAVRAAFDLWQNADPNILFLQKQDALTAEVVILFEEPSEIQKQEVSPIGLIRGNLSTLSSSRREGNSYIISLNAGFGWDSYALTRVVAYHVGKFLGLADSEEPGSFLNRIYLQQAIRLAPSDSIQLNALYSQPCAGDCNTFLPLSLPIRETVTKSIRVDKPGKITIKASNRMVVGFWLGWSTPDGLPNGLFSIPIGDYSIERSINHAALMYKLNHEEKWRACGVSCEFQTDGVSQCIDVTLGINDLNITDNSGAYDVVVDYKQ